MIRRPLLIGLAALLAMVFNTPAALATTVPSGTRMFHNAELEPVYNAESAGQIGFVLTPTRPTMHASPHAWSPIYVPVYPTGSTAATTYLCMHQPVENCPSHGDGVAAAAAAIVPDVYGDGVAGHDHVLDFPGGADFNIAWEPVLVLFTSKAAANEHLLTDTAIDNAVERHDAILVADPAHTFLCAVVPARLWDMAS